MNRRSYIVALGAGITLAGCSALSEKVDSFSVTTPTVKQGEKASISIEATDVVWMRFHEFPGASEPPGDEKPFEIKFENAEFTPSPATIWQGYPPTWSWSRAQNIVGEVPVQTFSDTPPRIYPLSITVSKSDSDEEMTKEVSITVQIDIFVPIRLSHVLYLPPMV